MHVQLQVGAQPLRAERIKEEDMEPEAPPASATPKIMQLPAPVSPPRVVGQAESPAAPVPPPAKTTGRAPPAAELRRGEPKAAGASAKMQAAVPTAAAAHVKPDEVPMEVGIAPARATGRTEAAATIRSEGAALARAGAAAGLEKTRSLRLANMVFPLYIFRKS